jgi:ketosteroid isomerase-like protein
MQLFCDIEWMIPNQPGGAKHRPMHLFRIVAIHLGLLALSAVTLASAAASPPPASADEQALWKLERAYWRYVQDNDLAAYSNLWHKDFLGWPASSAAPVRKDHITDWITSQTSQGLAFQAGEFRPASVQVTGNVAMAAYWITFKWLDKDGQGAAHTLRITHAWLRDGNDWRIIGGMSMPEPETPRKP